MQLEVERRWLGLQVEHVWVMDGVVDGRFDIKDMHRLSALVAKKQTKTSLSCVFSENLYFFEHFGTFWC